MSLQIAGAIFSAFGQIRAGQAESRRQAAIAAQQEQNRMGKNTEENEAYR